MSAGRPPPGLDASAFEPPLADLVRAWNDRDEAAFTAALGRLVRRDTDEVIRNVSEITKDIQCALARFCTDARVEDLSRREVPDARASLEHVLSLTDEAAHRTMDLVEQSREPASRTSARAAELLAELGTARGAVNPAARLEDVLDFVVAARADAEMVRANLTEVLLVQGYQDLSGQILRSVMHLTDEIQAALAGLVALSRGEKVDWPARTPAVDDPLRGSGPAVPGVDGGAGTVAGQDEVDLLLSGLDL